MFWALICVIAIGLPYFLFRDWSLKQEAIHKSALYDSLQESLELEARVSGRYLEDWILSDDEDVATPAFSLLKPEGYIAILLSSMEACSACRDRELGIWQQSYAAHPEAKGRIFLLIAEPELLGPAGIRRLRAGANSLPIEFPFFVDRDSRVLQTLDLRPEDTPLILLIDPSGQIIDTYHPTKLTIERSHRFVQDVFEVLMP